MSRGREIATLSLSYLAYAALLGKIFASPLAGIASYLAMVACGVYVFLSNRRGWKWYICIGLVGILVSVLVHILETF